MLRKGFSFLFLLGIFCFTLRSDGATGSGIDGLGSTVDFGVLPLVGGAPTGVETMFGSCVNSTQYTVNPNSFNTSAWKSLLNTVGNNSNILSAPGVTSTYNPGPMCTGGDTVESSDLSCESDASEYTARRESALRALAVIDCKERKISMVPGQLTCLSNQASKFEDLIRKMKDILAQQFQEAHGKVAEITTVIDDRTSQIQEVDKRLNGGRGGNPPGLIKLEEELQAEVDKYFGQGEGAQGGQGKIEELRQQQKKVADDRVRFNQLISDKTMGYTNECFNSKSKSTYRCSKGGPVVSPREYLLCRYEQNQLLGKDGATIENNKLSKSGASDRRNALEGVLSEIFSGTPSSGGSATGGNPVASNVFSVTTVEKSYGDLLSSFNGKGIDVHSYVMTNIQECVKYATGQIARDKANKNTEIAQAQNNITTQEQFMDTQVKSLLQKGSQLYAKTMNGLTGTGQIPISVQQCVGVKPDVQLNCVQNMGDQIKGLLDGTTKGSQVQMGIKGKDGQGRTNISFTCSGVRNCKQNLTTLQSNLGTEVERLHGVRKEYVSNFNASADKLLSDVTKALSPAADMLKKQIQMMNTNLAIMGATINIPDLTGNGAHFEPDEGKDMDGLYKMPQNVKDIVAANVDPKMPDLAGNNFTTALESISKVAQDLSQKRGKVTEVWASLSGKEKKCAKDKKKELADELDRKTQRAQDTLNSAAGKDCSKAARGALEAAIRDSEDASSRLRNSTTNAAALLNTDSALGGRGLASSSRASTGQEDDSACLSQAGSLNRATATAGSNGGGNDFSGAASAIGGALGGLVRKSLE